MSRSKFGSVKTVVDGRTFHSKLEAARYGQLKLLERAGEITNLECQPRYDLTIDGRPILIRSKGYPNGRQARVTFDFRYFRKGHGVVIEDQKGGKATRTEAYQLRKAVFEAIYWPVRVEEVG